MSTTKPAWTNVALGIGGALAVGVFGLWLYRRSQRTKPFNFPNGKSKQYRPEDFDPVELTRGMRVESEHSTDPQVQMRIAMDHLTEDPLYYRKLKAIHLDGAQTRRRSRNANRT